MPFSSDCNKQNSTAKSIDVERSTVCRWVKGDNVHWKMKNMSCRKKQIFLAITSTLFYTTVLRNLNKTLNQYLQYCRDS